MKCMVLEKFNEPLVLREREIPTPAADEAILRVGACGLCRTDLKIWHGTHPRISKVTLPHVPGHEVAGEVVEVGKSVSKELVGKHAVVYLYFSCGQCEFCRRGSEALCSRLRGQIGFSVDGGYAEYVKVPADSLFSIPPHLPFVQAAIVTDAIAAPYRALTARAALRPEEVLVVIGAGGLGIHAIQIAKVIGARVIAVDINEKALALATSVGANKTVHMTKDDAQSAILDFSGGGVQVVADFVAIDETQQLGLNVLQAGGRFVSIAYNAGNFMRVSSPLLIAKELQVCGSRSCGRKDLREAIDLLATSKIKSVIAACYPLTEANAGLKRLEQGDLVGRSVLVP